MANANYVFLLSLSIITIGYIVKKLKIITEDNGKVLVKVIFNITLPAVILKVVSSFELNFSLFLLPIISLVFSIFILIICYFLFRNKPKHIKGIILITVIGFNVGNFAFPLIEGIWGEEGLQYIAMLDIGNAFVIFGIINIIAAIFSPNNDNENRKITVKYIGLRLIKSVPLMSYIFALSINLSGLSLPIFVLDFLDILSRANMALSLLALGIFLNFKFKKSEWNNIIKILIIRYIFGFTIGLTLFLLLPFDLLYRTIVFICLILPMGMGTILFAVEFEHDDKIAGIVGNLTIIISFILIWIIVIIVGA